MEFEFKTGEAAKLTKVDGRRIAQFIHKRQIIPSVESRGQGRAAKLSLLDVLKIDILARLTESGMAGRIGGEIAAKAVRRAGDEESFSYELNPGMNLIIDLKECRERIFPEIDKSEFAVVAVVKKLNRFS